jgi:hypothetical protein
MPQAIQIAWIIKVFGTRTGVVFFFENPASDAEIKEKIMMLHGVVRFCI